MPDNATDKDAIQDELKSIHHCLMEPKYCSGTLILAT